VFRRRSEQIAQLQETVNGLLSMVGSQRLHQEQAAAFIPSPASLASPGYSGTLPGESPSIQFVHLPIPKVPVSDFTRITPLIVHDSVPFLNDSDSLLSIFHDRLAAQVPFVVIPAQLTAKDLHREKPMVYMTIMMAASYEDKATHQALGKVILQYLAQNAILDGKKSFDLLQGLLLYILWSAFSCFSILTLN
jgi:hypothetical protein